MLQFQECSSSNSSFCGTIIITGGCPLQSEIVALLSQRLNVIQVKYNRVHILYKVDVYHYMFCINSICMFTDLSRIYSFFSF